MKQINSNRIEGWSDNLKYKAAFSGVKYCDLKVPRFVHLIFLFKKIEYLILNQN